MLTVFEAEVYRNNYLAQDINNKQLNKQWIFFLQYEICGHTGRQSVVRPCCMFQRVNKSNIKHMTLEIT